VPITNSNAINHQQNLASPLQTTFIQQQLTPITITSLHHSPQQQQQNEAEKSSSNHSKKLLSSQQRKTTNNTILGLSKTLTNKIDDSRSSTSDLYNNDSPLTPPPPLPPQPPPSLLLTTSLSSSSSNQHLDLLKQQYEKVLQENNEITSKFKLLEQIHLDAINEYDKQQNRLYNQIDDMHLKCNTFEHEIDVLNKRLSQSKQVNESGLSQIKSLNQQLNEYKEKIVRQEKEIEKFNRQMENLSKFSENLDNVVVSNASVINAENHTQDSSRSWNIEVK
jgi:DNA repair exonuclease SbcCD ATPase subunit